MASYKDIQGFNIQNLTADPDNAGAIGQIYYNSTTGSFKAVEPGGIPAGTWASGANLDQTRYAARATGTTSAALLTTGANGTTPPPSGYLSDSIEYNGTSWGSPVAMNVPDTYVRTTLGVQTAAIAASGYQSFPSALTLSAAELYNGSTWTTTTSINSARSNTAGAGIQTNALIFAGYPTAVSPSSPSAVYSALTESWNGSTWTELNDLNTSRTSVTSFGSSPASTAICISGARSPSPGTPAVNVANVETWNGTSWTEVADVNTPRDFGGGAGTSQSDGIAFGGYSTTAATANTEHWNGTAWTELNNLATARYGVAGMGSSSAAIAAGNYYPLSGANGPEIWTAPDVVIKTLTTS